MAPKPPVARGAPAQPGYSSTDLEVRMENYLVAMATFACLYALLALGLNLVWGLAGMSNLGLVGFFAVGAYVSALTTKLGGVPIALGVVAARAGGAGGRGARGRAPARP